MCQAVVSATDDNDVTFTLPYGRASLSAIKHRESMTIALRRIRAEASHHLHSWGWE